jgi:hypothetical protein
MLLKKALVVSIIAQFLIHGMAVAQIQIKAIPQFYHSSEGARLKGTNDLPLQLPFWDDFSMSNNLIDTLWANTNCVTINNYIGIDAPTYNVATFNGVDASGKPYSSTPGFGKTDSLESQPINLGSLSSGQQGSLYFSFFWQAKGLGDKPNPTDSIRLQFKSNKDKWHTQWVMINDNAEKETRFHQKIMQVKNAALPIFVQDETFFHDGFQFRFQAYGNRGGDYDNWHIDYVYLNHGRHALDTTYQDEALTTPPTSLFQPYYSIPFQALLQDVEAYLAKPRIQYRNLTSIGTSPQLHAVVNVLENGNIIHVDSIRKRWTFNPLPQPGQVVWVDSINKLNPQLLAPFQDRSELRLETKVYLTANDPVYDRMNLRVNDTVRATTHLHDYYAYDDGTAETSLGIDRQGGRLAYLYTINGQDTITDIDIYFPSFSLTTTSSTIKIQIWDNLNTTRPVYQETYPVQHSSKINELKRYNLSKPIIVNDTFYIGYEQNVNQFLSVGYDRNTNSSDRLFYYVDLNQGWLPYHDKDNPSANVVYGSLMMRPVFRDNDVTGIRNPWEENNNIKVFPNPSHGIIHIEGDFDEAIVKVIDAYGRTLLATSLLNLDLKHLPSGIYFIIIATKQGAFTRKVVLRK